MKNTRQDILITKRRRFGELVELELSLMEHLDPESGHSAIGRVRRELLNAQTQRVQDEHKELIASTRNSTSTL